MVRPEKRRQGRKDQALETKGAGVAGFIRGVLWGAVVAAGGLVIVSQLAPPQEEATGPSSTGTLAPELRELPVPSEDQSAAAPGPVEAGAPQAAPEVEEAEPVPATPPSPAELAGKPDPGSTDTTASVSLPEPAPAPVAPPSLEGATVAPVSPFAPSAALVEGPATLPQASAPPGIAPPPSAPDAPQSEAGPPMVELPPPPPLMPEEEALLRPAPDMGAMAPLQPAAPTESLLVPPSALGQGASGVMTGRLPRIGDEADEDPSQPEPTIVPDPTTLSDLPPIQRFARPFEAVAGKPLFAILLEDRGGEANREELAAMDLPVTVVIDPLSEGAAERAAIWRAGGQEVVLSLAGLPRGATPADAEQTLAVLAETLPEAVAMIDPTGGLFQNDRALATQVVAILAEQGRGVVTFDQGLNAADQVARREGLASAVVFRRFDSDNANGPAVKRYLDRAVFKAAQEGEVAVIGALTPETVAGILEWAVEGRAATVNIAPLTALMAR